MLPDEAIPRLRVETMVVNTRGKKLERWDRRVDSGLCSQLFANHTLDRCVRFRSGSRIFPVLLNPRRRRYAFTKVEPVGTIRCSKRKNPKDEASKRGRSRSGRKRQRLLLPKVVRRRENDGERRKEERSGEEKGREGKRKKREEKERREV